MNILDHAIDAERIAIQATIEAQYRKYEALYEEDRSSYHEGAMSALDELLGILIDEARARDAMVP